MLLVYNDVGLYLVLIIIILCSLDRSWKLCCDILPPTFKAMCQEEINKDNLDNLITW